MFITSQKHTSCFFFFFNKNHNPYSSEGFALWNNLHTDGGPQSKEENAFVSMCTCTCVQSSPTLFNPVDCSLPGFSVHGIFQEYWIRLQLPTPGDLCCPGMEPMSLTSPVLAGRFFTSAPPGKFQWMTAKAQWLSVEILTVCPSNNWHSLGRAWSSAYWTYLAYEMLSLSSSSYWTITA